MPHTPGPWHVFLNRRDKKVRGRFPGIEARDGKTTIVLFGEADEGDLGIQGRDDTEAQANAKLIAAAPELLDACQALVERYGPASGYTGEQREELLAAESAIAKATRTA
jgi:hypothetical protein